MAETQYTTGQTPRIGDRVRLVDASGLTTQLDEPAEPGEYVVEDISWGVLLCVTETAAIWCQPSRCELMKEQSP